MNALIFLVPEDIVDVRPRLVRCYQTTSSCQKLTCSTDHDFRWEFDGHSMIEFSTLNYYSLLQLLYLCVELDCISSSEVTGECVPELCRDEVGKAQLKHYY